MVSVPGPSCRPSVQGVNPPVCCVLDDICKTVLCIPRGAFCPLGGGPGTLAPVLQFKKKKL